VSILRFEIRYPNGQRDAAVVEGERALIGSASYADVRLPVDQAAYEHVVIEAIGQTLRAQAKAQHPPATVNGMPLTSSPILPDTVLGVGSVQIFVSLASGDVERPRAGAQKEKKKEGSPIIRLLGLVALPVLGYMVMADDEPALPDPPAAAPALFASAAVPCPEPSPQAAMALAKELTQLSLPEIGSNFGGRDHTTVLHACRQIAKLRDSVPEISHDVNFLLQVLRN